MERIIVDLIAIGWGLRVVGVVKGGGLNVSVKVSLRRQFLTALSGPY